MEKVSQIFDKLDFRNKLMLLFSAVLAYVLFFCIYSFYSVGRGRSSVEEFSSHQAAGIYPLYALTEEIYSMVVQNHAIIESETDVVAMYRNDPAAHNLGEVILCYPGMRAITNYRIAHALEMLDVPLIPRMITEIGHSETGIDIHPGATIGHSFAIDHGTGVVIGATAILGHNVTLYQGVTLGAKNFPQEEDGSLVKGIARHPILGNNVVVYANATILGRIHIGDGSTIGGNIWLTHDVPAGTKLFYKQS